MPRTNILSRSRNYLFTIFETDAKLPTWDTLPNQVSFLVWQVERCPNTQRLHVQGYCELVKAQDLVWIKKTLGQGHYETRKGTQSQAIAYCGKEETRHAHGGLLGNPSRGRGSRNDLIGYRDAIVAGKRKRDLLFDMPVELCKYTRFYTTVREQIRPRRTNKLCVILALGQPGTGKTRFAYDHWSNSMSFFELPMCSSRIWFDGLDGHRLILLDDFDGRFSKMSLTFLLRLLDRYPSRVEVKGAFAWWMPDMVYITSNITPDQWYNFHGRVDQVSALRRRIHYILDFDQKNADGDPLNVTSSFDWSNYLCFDNNKHN